MLYILVSGNVQQGLQYLVCVFVCLSTPYSGTTRYEAAHEQCQWLKSYEGKLIETVAFKRYNYMAWKQVKSQYA